MCRWACPSVPLTALNAFPLCPHPDSIPHDVPQILINREQLPHLNFDVELLGDCDVIVNELCHRLGGDFEQLCDQTLRLNEITEKPPRLPDTAVETVTTTSESDNTTQEDTTQEETTQEETTQEGTARGIAPVAVTPVTPSEEIAGEMVTEAPGTADRVLPEPCPVAAEPLDASATAATTTTTSPTAESSESSEAPTDDTPKEEEAEVKRRNSNLDLRRRCWMSRLSRSPISKRLESKREILTLSP